MDLIPTWDFGDVPTAMDGTHFSFMLHAPCVGTAKISVERGENETISLNVRATEVVRVEIDGVPLAEEFFVRDGRNIVILTDNLTEGVRNLKIIGPQASISLVRGALPYGVSLGNAQLSGWPARMDQTIYSIRVRASYAGIVRDADIDIPAVLSPHILPEWTGFPIETVENGIGYRPLVSLARAGTFIESYELGVYDQFTKPVAIPARFEELPNYIPGLPPGLTMEGPTIKGTVDPLAQPGRYLFYMAFEGHELRNAYLCVIEITPAVSLAGDEVQDIVWKTPEGHIATLVEGDVSDVSVEAERSGQVVEYIIALGGQRLPSGMFLSLNGQLRGVVPHVDRDTTYRFRVKAISGSVYRERNFEVVVKNRHGNYSRVGELALRLPQEDRDTMAQRYANLIPQTAIFRSSDRNFGLNSSLSIYVIKGLRPENPIEAIKQNTYHYPLALTLGRHRLATVYDDNGKPKYETIYREVLDPQDKAGGFRRDTTAAVEEKVVWPQSPASGPIQYVYPNSLRNVRSDLVATFGMATNNESLVRTLGRSGVEVLPKWMKDGYVAGMVVAYVNPGQGAAIVDALNQIINSDEERTFRRYYSVIHDDFVAEETSFDSGTTTFDGSTGSRIFFDASDSSVRTTAPLYSWN